MKKNKDNESELTNLNPHDGAFREFFSNRTVALSFIKENLPPSIAHHLDFRTLKISKDSFIDEQFIRSHSDLLYQIKYKNYPLLLYLLFEHKSFADWQVAFQLLKYMLRIWELYLKQNEGCRKLPAILPLVIYHGKAKWGIDKRFGSLFDIPEELKPYVPDVVQKALPPSIKNGGDFMATIAQQWLKEGMENKDWIVVENSLSMGLSADKIAKITGLTIERVKQMINQINRGKK